MTTTDRCQWSGWIWHQCYADANAANIAYAAAIYATNQWSGGRCDGRQIWTSVFNCFAFSMSKFRRLIWFSFLRGRGGGDSFEWSRFTRRKRRKAKIEEKIWLFFMNIRPLQSWFVLIEINATFFLPIWFNQFDRSIKAWGNFVKFTQTIAYLHGLHHWFCWSKPNLARHFFMLLPIAQRKTEWKIQQNVWISVGSTKNWNVFFSLNFK